MQHLQKSGGGTSFKPKAYLSSEALFVRSLPRYLFTSLLRAPLLARSYGGPAGEYGGAVDEGRTPVVRLLRRSRQRGSSPEARRGLLDPAWRACPAWVWQARAGRHR